MLTGICEEIVFSNFFKSHAKALRNYLLYKYGNEEQAEDVTQEAFIKLWENCANVPLEKAKSFLYTVANNTSLTFYRLSFCFRIFYYNRHALKFPT